MASSNLWQFAFILKDNWNNSPPCQPQQTHFIFFLSLKYYILHVESSTTTDMYERKSIIPLTFPVLTCPQLVSFQTTSMKTHRNVQVYLFSLHKFGIMLCMIFATCTFLLKNFLNILLRQYAWFHLIHFKVCKKLYNLVVFCINTFLLIKIVCFFSRTFLIWQCSVKVGQIH